MQYYSTNQKSAIVDFEEATLNGQAPDKGLYFPREIAKLGRQFWSEFPGLSKEEIAYRVIQPFTGSTIAEDDLYRIVSETVNFPFPLKKINDHAYALELYHGPTLAFKDVGARFMSRCLGHFVRDKGVKSIVLVATSGDTGGAVASGFHGVPGVEVVILYPSGKVSNVQEKQLTTLGENIHALEVSGNFDDCQRMVKEAFADTELRKQLFLTSANSINVARWLPQQFYYFYAYQQWMHDEQLPVFSVPSGNFGNICAGLMAYSAGLPVKHFVAACNANDVIPRFFSSGTLEPREAIPTISNAMDVGNPSNFIRILEIFNHQIDNLKQIVSTVSISDADTKSTMKEVISGHGYLLDPHGAVGYKALLRYLEHHPDEKGIILETAHPVKFHDVVEPVLGIEIELPPTVKELVKLPKVAQNIGTDYTELKSVLQKFI